MATKDSLDNTKILDSELKLEISRKNMVIGLNPEVLVLRSVADD